MLMRALGPYDCASTVSRLTKVPVHHYITCIAMPSYHKYTNHFPLKMRFTNAEGLFKTIDYIFIYQRLLVYTCIIVIFL
jgi:hypothetical protein